MCDPNKTSTASNKFSATGSKILVWVHTSESSTESLETLGFCLQGMVWCANKLFHSENSLEQPSVHSPQWQSNVSQRGGGNHRGSSCHYHHPGQYLPLTAQAPLQLHSPSCQSLYCKAVPVQSPDQLTPSLWGTHWINERSSKEKREEEPLAAPLQFLKAKAWGKCHHFE